ncbi:uncharacterized protein SCHCODRAFT_02636972 [Schizophyllum commune H4-8]|uniref:uncharacterized protein n=1 Tax=Schizophyllum commune (strain H4-8 / FGSC 9210) TaxID=578458 RepID=UPI00215FAE21|nr:uncharacterized protein SCHCODRAFT_02636972 [Schizophyllum commune H4-8]KAI5888531.1 hypothetical protein SCHCODRAFT_02636972 [Schizophyllum commune H4-8]
MARAASVSASLYCAAHLVNATLIFANRGRVGPFSVGIGAAICGTRSQVARYWYKQQITRGTSRPILEMRE